MHSALAGFWTLILALNALITARVYRMALTTGTWYYQANSEARYFQSHFKAYLTGNIAVVI